ncbi:MAG TPA: glycosyltransferase family 39 protein [Thermomicrobiales bacterium]|nr:glycosyltransferase family 39 protein [Thermomicrobiales bacterium]
MISRVAIRDRFPRGAGPGGLLLLLVALVGAVALLARLPGLDTSPPGFALDEARAALHARSIGLDGAPFPLLPDSAAPGAREPLFAWQLKLTGSLSGWSVAGARAATALAGVVVAVCCALWLRRALGAGWGIAGGLLVATSFWQLTLSRQVSAGMAGAALLALGVWLLWGGFDTQRAAMRRRAPGWIPFAGAGAAFGLALYAFAPLLAFVPVVPAACGLAAWRMHRERRPFDGRGLAIGLAVMLAVVAPVAIDAALHVDEARERIESALTHTGAATGGRGPLAIARGLATTVESLFWRGPDNPRVNIPGRALLDPLLALWTALGIGYAARFAGRPLHAFALAWLAGSCVVTAVVAPGQPELLLAATPAVFLFPMLALRSAYGYLRPRGALARELAQVIVAGAVVASAGWSAFDYTERWSSSPATWAAFSGDTRAALAALADLPDRGEPVYFSTWDERPLVELLIPERPPRIVDGRATLAIPDASGGYLVFARSGAPDRALLRYVNGAGSASADEPFATGTGPDGEVAWEIWRIGQSARERLPYTLPSIRFPNRIQLVGFAFAPDFGDVATTGALPDPPRLVVVLVWTVPRDMRPHLAEVRLVPADQPHLDEAIESATVWLSPLADATRSPSAGREIVLQRVSVVVPETGERIVDIQVTLWGPDGEARPPYGPSQLLVGDYAFLNRIQYRPGVVP